MALQVTGKIGSWGRSKGMRDQFRMLISEPKREREQIEVCAMLTIVRIYLSYFSCGGLILSYNLYLDRYFNHTSHYLQRKLCIVNHLTHLFGTDL